MATGRGIYLKKQTGEYLVAAELCRRGCIATTFTGNVPHYDIVAVDESGAQVLLQVKTILGNSWQFNVGRFAQITFEGRRQVIGDRTPEPYPGLLCVLVQLRPMGTTHQDRFFIMPWTELCRLIIDLHSQTLQRCGGIRPRRDTEHPIDRDLESLADGTIHAKRMRPLRFRHGFAACIIVSRLTQSFV